MRVLDFSRACRIKPWEHLTKQKYKFGGCKKAAEAYRDNLLRANGLLLLPGNAFMSGEMWSVCVHGAKRAIFGDKLPTEEEVKSSQSVMVQIAKTVRDDSLKEQTPESMERMFFTALHNIEVFSQESPPLRRWMLDVFRSALILAWGSYEVLAEQLWTSVVAHRPSLDARSRDEKRWSGHRSRSKIANLYKFTFRMDNAEIMRCVDSHRVHALGIVRNVLVHNAGRIDADFIKDRIGVTPLNRIRAKEKGRAVHVNGAMVRHLIDPVTPLGFGLVKAVDEWLIAHP